MAGLIEAGTYRVISQDGLTEKDITIDNSGNPLFDSTRLAKQSDIGTANSSLVKTALNAGGSAPIYACRAWVNFNGTGTPAVTAGGNVSSITDVGTGVWRVNFATAMPNANYAAEVTCETTAGAVGYWAGTDDDFTNTTSACGVRALNDGGAAADRAELSVAIFI